MKLLSNIPTQQLAGKNVLVRVDFNEPLKGNQLKDGFRVRAARGTVSYLLKHKARVILVAHLEGNEDKSPVLFARVLKSFEKNLGMNLVLVKEYSKEAIDRAFKKNNVVILENVRFHVGEKKNDSAFSKLLASFADLYVNDAFSVAHRAHASVVGVTKYVPSCAGFLLEREVRVLHEVLAPEHPFLLIIGGAKFETKFALIKNFMKRADAIFLGGVLANTFLKAHGINIGASLFEKGAIAAIRKHFIKSKKVILPFDVRVSKSISKSVFEIEKGETIQDIGPETVAVLGELARDTKYILWNGPLGYTEGGFDSATRDLLKIFSKLKKTKVILGGGDTVEVVDELGLKDAFYHVSTGGGAMLDYLADGTLPGIEALKK